MAERQIRQQETIAKVIQWLREEGYEPEERTDRRKDLAYFGRVKIDERSGFHVEFPVRLVDSVIVTEVIGLDRAYQLAYEALQPLDQNRFFFDLKSALLLMNVIFELQKGVRQLQTLKVMKPVYFDGLTKDRFFDTIYTVRHTIELAQVKLGQFRDSILPSHAGDSNVDENLK